MAPPVPSDESTCKCDRDPPREGVPIGLDQTLEDGAGLMNVRAKKTGDAECRFRVSAVYDGDAEMVTRRVLAALSERVAYGHGDGVVTWTTSEGVTVFSFLTQHPEIGVATACITISSANTQRV